MAEEKATKTTTEEETKPEETTEETTEETKEEATPKTEEAPAEKEEASKAEAKEEAPAEAATAGEEEASEESGENVEVPEKFKALVEQVENMTVLELNELVKLLENKFGVSAQAAVAAAPADAEGAEEEQSMFTVELTAAGDQKIGVIKAVKAALGLGLKEAKDLVEGAPAVLKEGAPKEEAEELKNQVEEAGGQVTLK